MTQRPKQDKAGAQAAPEKKKFELLPEVQALLRAPNAERILFIQQDRWIGYPRAREALAVMERLFDYPDTRRPPNQLIVGETNNGKTTLVDRFVELHLPVDDEYGQSIPVVKLDAPQSPSEDRLYNHILEHLQTSFSLRGPTDGKFFQICDLLRDMGTRVLILDEINNSTSGTHAQREGMFNAIREISNKTRRPIILTGTFDALSALREQRQNQNRFPPLVLPKWDLETDKDFRQLLASFEATLPLKRRSFLSSAALAPLLLVMSGGTIGELHGLLIRAAEAAIANASERITRTLLLALPWIPPEERDAQASAAEYGHAARIDYRARLKKLGHTELVDDKAAENIDAGEDPLPEETDDPQNA